MNYCTRFATTNLAHHQIFPHCASKQGKQFSFALVFFCAGIFLRLRDLQAYPQLFTLGPLSGRPQLQEPDGAQAAQIVQPPAFLGTSPSLNKALYFFCHTRSGRTEANQRQHVATKWHPRSYVSNICQRGYPSITCSMINPPHVFLTNVLCMLIWSFFCRNMSLALVSRSKNFLND